MLVSKSKSEKIKELEKRVKELEKEVTRISKEKQKEVDAIQKDADNAWGRVEHLEYEIDHIKSKKMPHFDLMKVVNERQNIDDIKKEEKYTLQYLEKCVNAIDEPSEIIKLTKQIFDIYDNLREKHKATKYKWDDTRTPLWLKGSIELLRDKQSRFGKESNEA